MHDSRPRLVAKACSPAAQAPGAARFIGKARGERDQKEVLGRHSPCDSIRWHHHSTFYGKANASPNQLILPILPRAAHRLPWAVVGETFSLRYRPGYR